MIPPEVQAQIDEGFAAAELQIWRERLLKTLDGRIDQWVREREREALNRILVVLGLPPV